MKPSHMTTPRQMRDCMFGEWGAAIERQTVEDYGHATATLLCVLILIGFALYLAATWGA